MSPPRVLFVDHAGVLGGAELYLLDIARHFRETCRVILFENGPFRERLRTNNVPVEVCPAPVGFLDTQKSGGLVSALTSLPGLVYLSCRVARRARNYDLLYANSQKSLFVAGLAGLLAGRPVIWNLHDILTSDRFGQLNRRGAVLCANHLVDHVIVNSRATQAAFAESGGRPGKTSVVYNGIDTDSFRPSALPTALKTRDRLDLPEAPLVGMFSRLAPWKGQHIVLEALSHLPEVHGVFVGDSLFRGDDPYEDKLRRTARRLGVDDRVHFLGFRDDIPALMHAVDIVVHASTQPEPFGRVIVEGMLANRPVIATRAGGAKEIVDHGETGILTDPGDPRDLASAVERLVANPEEARRVAEAGRRSAIRRFSSENMVSEVSDIIQGFAVD